MIALIAIIAGVLESYFDHLKIFGYVRNVFLTLLPTIAAARLYELNKQTNGKKEK